MPVISGGETKGGAYNLPAANHQVGKEGLPEQGHQQGGWEDGGPGQRLAAGPGWRGDGRPHCCLDGQGQVVGEASHTGAIHIWYQFDCRVFFGITGDRLIKLQLVLIWFSSRLGLDTFCGHEPAEASHC